MDPSKVPIPNVLSGQRATNSIGSAQPLSDERLAEPRANIGDGRDGLRSVGAVAAGLGRLVLAVAAIVGLIVWHGGPSATWILPMVGFAILIPIVIRHEQSQSDSDDGG